MMRIPETGELTRCPKCCPPGAADEIPPAIGTAYHAAPDAGDLRDPHPCFELVQMRVVDLGEHLCRKCSRCGFGWVERVGDPRSVYEPPEPPEPPALPEHGS